MARLGGDLFKKKIIQSYPLYYLVLMYVGNFAGGDFFLFFFSPVVVVSHYWFFLSGLACVTFCVAIGMKAVKFYIIKLPLK